MQSRGNLHGLGWMNAVGLAKLGKDLEAQAVERRVEPLALPAGRVNLDDGLQTWGPLAED